MSDAEACPPEVDCVVIGGGVVGASVAQTLQAAGAETWVLEAGPRIAEGVTSRNSGVIHAGLYYPPTSFKARLCVEGNARLYEYCVRRGIPHRRTGKWVVAQADDASSLDALEKNAAASGARGLRRAGSADLAELTRHGVRAAAAVWSAETGIVDPYELTRSLREDAEAQGATYVLECRVRGAARGGRGGYVLDTDRGEIRCSRVVNAAGLDADVVANYLEPGRHRIYGYRGDYFRWTRPRPLPWLIYPAKVPGAPGLGIHLTLDLAGGSRFGPDAEGPGEKEDFGDPVRLNEKRARFAAAASRYLDGVTEADLAYDSCGVRPKLRAPEDREDPDFRIESPFPGWVNLVGIESPGLTAALAIAPRVWEMLG